MNQCLIISYYFPPYNGIQGIRAAKFAKFLPGYGWEPNILASNYLEPDKYDEKFLDELPNICTINRVSDWRYKIASIRSTNKQATTNAFSDNSCHSNIGFLKFIHSTVLCPDGKNSWFIPAIKEGSSIIRNKDVKVIFATGYPWTALLVGNWLSKKFDIPFVADFRDPWTLNSVSIWNTKLNSYLERKVLFDASACVFTTHSTKQLYSSKYPSTEEKLEVIYNGYDDTELNMSPVLSHAENDYFVVTYTGTLGATQIPPAHNKRSSYYFLKALKRFVDNTSGDPKIVVRFYGGMSAAYQSFIVQNNLDEYVEVHPFVSREKVIEVQKSSNLLLLLVAPENGQFISSKVFEYMATRKRVLGLVPDNTEVSSILQGYGNATVCSPTSIEDISIVLTIEYAKWIDGFKQELGQVSNQYSRRQQTSKLADIFSRVTGQKGEQNEDCC